MGVRRRVSSGGPWEARYGYSRAVVDGDSCWISGTTDAGPDGHSLHPGDPGGQARAAFAIAERALAAAGFSLADVVRTRMFVTDMSRSPAVLEVHGQLFGEVRPASTIVEVSALIDTTLMVEVELEARRG